jgi:hypothetical protein
VDNSNTQFAVLALWIGRRHNVPVNHPLFLAERRFRKTQRPTGGWGYGASFGTDESPAMTCSGLLALALGFSASRETGVTIVRSGRKFDAAGPEGGTTKGSVPPRDSLDTDPQILKAQQFLIKAMKEYGERPIPNLLYYMWSLERVCMTYGWDRMAGFDWYEWGARILLQSQQQDGSWNYQSQSGIVADTAFGILFLKKANLAYDARRIIVRTGDPTKVAKTPPANPKASKPEDNTPPPKTREEIEAEDAKQLADVLLKGGGQRQLEALRKLRDTPGKAYTLALADAVKKVGGGAWQLQLRDALSERLTRQTANSLSFYLASDEKELKLAATWAAALKPCKEVIPDVIPLLGDTDETVSNKAYEALKILSGGQDFGKAEEKWKAWWNKSGRQSDKK